MTRFLCALFIGVCFWANLGWAANDPGARAVKAEELVGYWDYLPSEGDGVDKRYPHQVLIFKEDGVFKSIHSNVPITSGDIERALVTPDVIRYTMPKESLIQFEWTDVKRFDFAMGTFIDQPIQKAGQPVFQRGDIILSYLSTPTTIREKRLIRPRK